jgi:hypothetical protein
MSSRRRFIALLLLVSACAANAPGGSAPSGDRNVLTQKEMLDQHFQDAYQAVSALRNQWLQSIKLESFSRPSQIWVYQDNVRLGDVESLRNVPVNTILSIRHFNANEATARWGVGHAAGAIYIETLSASTPPR